MTLLRSALYQLCFVVWTVLLGVLGLPLLLAPRRAAVGLAVAWVKGALVLQRTVLGLGYQIRGRDNLPAGPALFASKHQSAWETLVFHALLDDPAIIIKKELLWLPIVGWYLAKTGQVAIDRGGAAAALRKMTGDCRAAIAAGRSIVIFPEGHRQPPGATGAYHPGAALLYGELGVPLVPIALNSGLYWRRNAFLRRSGTVIMEFLPPLPGGLPRRRVMAELEARVEPATRALEAEAVAAHPELAARLARPVDESATPSSNIADNPGKQTESIG